MIGKPCAGRVIRKGLNFPRTHSCLNVARIKRGRNWFCRVHDPEAVKARAEARMSQKKIKMAALWADGRVRAAARALRAHLLAARQYVADAASAHAPPPSPPYEAFRLLKKIDTMLKFTGDEA